MAKKAKVNKKVGKKVKKAAAKSSGSKVLGPVNPRPGSVAEIIVRGLQAKKEPEAIVKDIKKKHPKSKSGVKDVSWYKWRIGSAGVAK